MGGFSKAAVPLGLTAAALATPFIAPAAAVGATGAAGAGSAAAAGSAAGMAGAGQAASSGLSFAQAAQWAGLGMAGLGAIGGYQQQRAAERYQRAQMEREAQFARQEYDRREKQRRNLLAREQASARARMGALGIGSTGGSAAAVLDGLTQPYLDQIAGDRAGLDYKLSGMTMPESSAAQGLAMNLANIGLKGISLL